MNRVQTAEELKLKSGFETIRNVLLKPEFADRLDCQIAYWTLPSDRRLPLSLLSFTVRQILDRPFDVLASTPGIGQKKLHSLILLLERATQDRPPSAPITVAPNQEPVVEVADRFRPIDAFGKFDSSLVSEALWREWRETAELHNLENERLGRLAPSLQELPTVIWDTPLSAYAKQSLTEIRSLRTHGEKRVRVVLEVFFVVHEMLHQTGRHSRLSVRLVPTFVTELEPWFQEVLNREELPTLVELRENLALPLIEQMELDAASDVVRLAKGRLAIDGTATTVRQQSRELGVTRARVYQLLEECERVMAVRWPEGRRYFQDLQNRMSQDGADPAALELFNATFDLFFPRKYEKVETVLAGT